MDKETAHLLNIRFIGFKKSRERKGEPFDLTNQEFKQFCASKGIAEKMITVNGFFLTLFRADLNKPWSIDNIVLSDAPVRRNLTRRNSTPRIRPSVPNNEGVRTLNKMEWIAELRQKTEGN